MNTSDEEEVEDEKDDDRLKTCVSSPGMFFLTSFFVTNFLFVLGMNRTMDARQWGNTALAREGREM